MVACACLVYQLVVVLNIVSCIIVLKRSIVSQQYENQYICLVILLKNRKYPSQGKPLKNISPLEIRKYPQTENKTTSIKQMISSWQRNIDTNLSLHKNRTPRKFEPHSQNNA